MAQSRAPPKQKNGPISITAPGYSDVLNQHFQRQQMAIEQQTDLKRNTIQPKSASILPKQQLKRENSPSQVPLWSQTIPRAPAKEMYNIAA